MDGPSGSFPQDDGVLFYFFLQILSQTCLWLAELLGLGLSKYEPVRWNSEKSKNLKKIHSIALGELLLEI